MPALFCYGSATADSEYARTGPKQIKGISRL